MKLLQNDIELTFNGFYTNLNYDYKPSIKYDKISMDTTERKLIYNTYNSKIIVDRTISFDIVNISTADETIIKNLSTITLQIEKEDYYNNYSGKVSYFIYDYVKDIQIVKTARIEIAVDSQERDATNPVSDYIAYYPIVNGSLNDVSGNNYHLTNTNATLGTGVKGETNGAFVFAGTNAYLQPSSVYDFASIDKVSLSCWVNFTAGENYNNFIRMGLNTENVIDLRGYGNSIQTEIAIPYDSLSQSFTNFNAWVHIVMTYAETRLRLYIDTIQYIKTTTQKALANNTWRIGRSTTQERDDTPNGKIGKIRIYNRELSASEIVKIYNFEKP